MKYPDDFSRCTGMSCPVATNCARFHASQCDHKDAIRSYVHIPVDDRGPECPAFVAAKEEKEDEE